MTVEICSGISVLKIPRFLLSAVLVLPCPTIKCPLFRIFVILNTHCSRYWEYKKKSPNIETFQDLRVTSPRVVHYFYTRLQFHNSEDKINLPISCAMHLMKLNYPFSFIWSNICWLKPRALLLQKKPTRIYLFVHSAWTLWELTHMHLE